MNASSWSKSSDVRFRSMGAETIVVRQNEGEVLVLNELGGAVLDWVEKGWSRERMVSEVVRLWDVAEDEASQDVDDFLSQLLAAGVVQGRSET